MKGKNSATGKYRREGTSASFGSWNDLLSEKKLLIEVNKVQGNVCVR